MNNHPKVDFPTSNKARVLNVLSLLAIIGMLTYIIIIYPTLPNKLPMHFNAAGDADGWGGKNAIFTLPLISIITYIPMYLISKAPHTFNLPVTITEKNAPRVYTMAQFFMSLFNFETIMLFCYLVFISIPGGFSFGVYFLPIMILVYLGTLIIFVVRVRHLK